MATSTTMMPEDPLWYKEAVFYQLHVKAYHDGNGDGIGDFEGLIERLDYLENLGVTAIWLLPFYPSPMRDDGYDIADYRQVHPDYGTLRHFRSFLREAHKRGIRVITELVINHTSDQHSWFQRARNAKTGTKYRDYYVWSDTPDRYSEARIIFKDFEYSNWTYDPVAGAYYWHRFYSHQPDLNFDNPEVRKMVFKILDFWFDMGVDGLRLDAVPYLFERDGTNCENLPETYAFLRELRRHIDEKYRDRMLLAEANQWPEDAVAYFGNGDICHMAFHFPLMPRMYIALQMEDRFPIIDIMDQTPEIPDESQWAVFLRNHDELTLEMVTDEERDYMYRVYAQDTKARINLGIRRRLAPLLSNDRRKIELLNILLFSMQGTPVVYYGDEIGMGDNYYLGDRNGVRTPMQWSSDKNAGFSVANPQRLYLPIIIDPEYNYEAINVDNQERNLASLLWWMKRVIAIRKEYRAFSRGAIEFLYPPNPKVIAFIRHADDHDILVVANLSRSSQVVELELSDYAGYVPEEIFSNNSFPTIRRDAYMLTLGAYGYFWFCLKKGEIGYESGGDEQIPEVATKVSWKSFPDADTRRSLERTVLPRFLKRARWFGDKSLTIRRAAIAVDMPLSVQGTTYHVLMLDVSYTQGSSSRYLLPLAFAPVERNVVETIPQAVVARATLRGHEGHLFDAVYDEQFARGLLQFIGSRKHSKLDGGMLVATRSSRFRRLLDERGTDLGARILRAEQSNSSVLYENRFFLKLFRKLEAGMSPDAEITQFLTEKAGFPYVPPFAGALEFRHDQREVTVLGLLQGFVANQEDAWNYTLSSVGTYFRRVLEEKPEEQLVRSMPANFLHVDVDKIPMEYYDYLGGFFIEMVALLGTRTGELHRALASCSGDPSFEPEAFTTLYQRGLYQSMRSLARRSLQTLSKGIGGLAEELQDHAREIAGSEREILQLLSRIRERKIGGKKIRTHGDYHLGQVLFTGKDFAIIDFEGEPARPISERRLKRSPLRDVAGMIRSFHYAVHTALRSLTDSRPEDRAVLEPWVIPWYVHVSGIYYQAYARTVSDAGLLPERQADVELLLQIYLMEKAVYELNYELNNRPDWVAIPMAGIAELLVTLAETEKQTGYPV